MNPENSLHIKFVLSCMINNVVFYENTTFLFGLLKSSKSVSKQRDAVGSRELIIWYIDGEPMVGSDLVHIRRDIIRSINSSGAYLSIMVRFFRCMIRDPTRRIYVIFLLHIRNLESVLTNDGKVSPISIIDVQIQFFSSEKITIIITIIIYD